MLFGTDNVRDAHADVVNDCGEIVKRTAVGAENYRIAHIVGLDGDVAANQIVYGDSAFQRHFKPQRRGRFMEQPLAFGGRRITVGAAMDIIVFGFLRLFAVLFAGFDEAFGCLEFVRTQSPISARGLSENENLVETRGHFYLRQVEIKK